jgi:hypothetical protein
MPIHDFHTYHNLDKLKEIVANKNISQSEDLMKALFPLKNKKIGKTLQDIINRFESSAKYKTPLDWFFPQKYETFMEYFKRNISKKKAKDIEAKTIQFTMVMPCEANIESIRDFTDTSSILRLKKPAQDVVKDLIAVGITDISTMEFISLKLLKCFYHRVHCPIDGIIQNITFIGKEEPLFGNNSLWVVEFNSEFGRIYMLLVGELSIQDFTFKLKIGDKVRKFDELGNFNWGSQIVLIYEYDSFRGDVLIQEKEKYFVGDGIFENIKTISPTNWEELPDTTYSRNQYGAGLIIGPGDTGSPQDATIF